MAGGVSPNLFYFMKFARLFEGVLPYHITTEKAHRFLRLDLHGDVSYFSRRKTVVIFINDLERNGHSRFLFDFDFFLERTMGRLQNF